MPVTNITKKGEGGSLVSAILQVIDFFNINGVLWTVDIDKAFDSVDHEFALIVLAKNGFENNLIKWIRILLRNQEFSTVNGYKTAKYKLMKDSHQGDPMLAYLFSVAVIVIFATV